MILNLGISPNFGFIDFEHLTFPTVMSVDYVRVYQNPDNINIGCEPDGFPTQSYINQSVLPLILPRLEGGSRSFSFHQVPRRIWQPKLDHMEGRLQPAVPRELVHGPMLIS